MSRAAVEIARLIAVVALMGVAAALLTPKDRVPLALRGLEKLLRKDRAAVPSASAGKAVSFGRRLLGCALVFAAILLAVLKL